MTELQWCPRCRVRLLEQHSDETHVWDVCTGCGFQSHPGEKTATHVEVLQRRIEVLAAENAELRRELEEMRP